MNAKELFIHDSRKRKRAEGFHTSFVDSLRVLMLAFELECEVVCQMPAFVVAAHQPKCVWVPYL